MKTTRLLLTLCSFSLWATQGHAAPPSIEHAIRNRALIDGIDLSVIAQAPEALAAIANLYRSKELHYPQSSIAKPALAMNRTIRNIVDVHTHIVPDWYRAIVPYTGGLQNGNAGGSPMPTWNITAHLEFMTSFGISHSVVGFSSPGANAYLRDKQRTVALARLINEYSAALSRALPKRFSFLASIPLPYAQEAIREARYSINELGAVGLALMSNHEGKYLGHESLTPFWRALDGIGGRQVVYVHPTTSYILINDTLIPSNPYTDLSNSRMEFYMETARTFMDLTIKQVIHNFTNVDFILPHLGGAFPGMIDRVLKTVHTDLYNSSLDIYRTRFWWDSASPTYFHQIDGLLAYGIPKGNLLYGSDYPFIEAAETEEYLQAIIDSTKLTKEEKVNLLSKNYKRLFGHKLWF
ncbi:hypothetical protein NMY22_g17531 [Coprinellus aureogranulatus]|nr:hypothetical protein NMY22_g17531 [Coprinellus aureogranulatus]